MTTTGTRRLNRLSRVHYGPRALGFAASFVIVYLLALERGWPAHELILPAAFLLVYPHLLFVLMQRVGASRKQEVRAMLFDCFMLGVLVADIGFFLWLSFAWLSATVLNNVVVGGVRQLLRALLLFGSGAVLGAAITGWKLVPNGPFLIEVMAMALLLAYSLVVGFVAYKQNARLLKISRELEERNRIFRALVEISASSDLATDVDDFITEALQRVHRLYPQNGLGLVVRRADRAEVIRFASFAGVSEGEQQIVIEQLKSIAAPDEGYHVRVDPDDGAPFHLLFMKGRIRDNEGLIVVRAERISQLLHESMDLFLELLAATIENKLMARELKEAAERDPLTGIFNRGYLDAELAHAIRNRRHYPAMDFAVLMMDVVGLKEINDSRGHAAGDRYIRETARLLQGLCRSTDVLVRFGGDEFVILCHGNSLDGAQGLARRIDEHVQGTTLNLAENAGECWPVVLRLSLGLASSSDTPPDQVLARADDAMYRNKDAWYANQARYR